VDPRQADRIADALEAGPDDVVLEIGSGLGALTLPLARRAGRVVAIERDASLASALADILASHGVRPTVDLVVADALRLPFTHLKELAAPGRQAGTSSREPRGRVLVAGNLPYGITSPLLLWLVDAPGWHRAVVMVQKEVADRLVAAPSTPEYGSLTVAVATRCRVRHLFDVSRRCFFPSPEVDSTVLQLEPLPQQLAPEERTRLEQVLRAAFGQRRKTLRNALRSLTPDPAEVAAILERAGVDGALRGEALDPERFVELARAWAAIDQRRRGPDML